MPEISSAAVKSQMWENLVGREPGNLWQVSAATVYSEGVE